MTAALVTGGSQGIGFAIAKELLAFQEKVILVARSEEGLQHAAERLRQSGNEIITIPTDLADTGQVDRLVQAVRDSVGNLSVLVNAAGSYASDSGADADDRYLMAVNYHGPVRLTAGLLPLLTKSQGHIVFINSTQGRYAGKESGAYAASKFALRAFADSLRAKVNPSGSRVLTVFAGSTATPMQAAIHERAGRAYHPEGLVQPADIAAITAAALRLPRTAEVTDLTIRPLQPPG